MIREEALCAGHSAIAAFCHEASAYRLFRVDRIVAMATIDDGELIDPFEHIAALRRDGLPFVHKGMGTFAKALVFLARCDGHDHAMEWVAIEDALAHYAMRFGGDDDDIRAAICACRKLAPDSGDFANSLVEFYRTPQHQRRKVGDLILHSCAAIVDADGRHTDEEIAWGTGIGRAVKLLCQ
ncbi:hypothetical protein ASG37_05035 [Sphingomonas sp. Leaf407]|nr:hypothetical protein ASE97_10950 [Sphingomonas sp. Leaf42]KQT30454.1 hypothetical protein ASG37_05035 [Sphingomonas sp. Leaf407]